MGVFTNYFIKTRAVNHYPYFPSLKNHLLMISEFCAYNSLQSTILFILFVQYILLCSNVMHVHVILNCCRVCIATMSCRNPRNLSGEVSIPDERQTKRDRSSWAHHSLANVSLSTHVLCATHVISSHRCLFHILPAGVKMVINCSSLDSSSCMPFFSPIFG